MQNSNISLTMHIKQDGDHSKTSYDADANFLEKDGKFFLFFNEVEGEDVTRCRFEISDHSFRMRRDGQVVVEQAHMKDQETIGYIKTPFGRVETTLQTFQYSFTEQPNGHYYLDLGYDLYTGGEKVGTYLLEITIIQKEEVVS